MQGQDKVANRSDHMDESAPAPPPPRPVPFAIFPNDPIPPGLLLTRVGTDRSVGFFGPFDADLLAARAASFISSNSDANEPILAQVMNRFLNLAQDDYKAGIPAVSEAEAEARSAPSCWLCIRMTLPTDDWVVPRWHTDGRMFDCVCPEPQMPHSKYAFTILGPSTRVMIPNPAVSALLETPSPTGRRWDQNEPDPELADRMAEYPEAAVQLGQAIRFSWGQRDSPVHSEPDSSDMHRIFVSILFGSEDEIRNMCDFRGTEYGLWN